MTAARLFHKPKLFLPELLSRAMIRVRTGADPKAPALLKRTEAMGTVITEVMLYMRRLPHF